VIASAYSLTLLLSHSPTPLLPHALLNTPQIIPFLFFQTDRA
jgi:hypothetical protein